jgi:16S rRNA (cytosine967-C5)-methyltransferase
MNRKAEESFLPGMPSARELALTALHEIWQQGSKPKTALEHAGALLDKRDRAFLMEIVYGVVRFRDTLDWLLKRRLKRHSALSRRTFNNLRVGAYQIIFMRVPGWAAINESVELEKGRGRPPLVNAILRGLSRDAENIKTELREMTEKDDAGHIALFTSHPEWLIRRWIARYGIRGAREFAEANNRVPPMTLRVNTLRAERDEMVGRLGTMGIRAEPTRFSPDGIVLGGFRRFTELPVIAGLISVQDEASQLVAYLLDPHEGEKVLDACAAPGGKTTHIAQLMNDKGEIAAVDADEARIGLLRENVSALGLKSVRVVNADITGFRPEGSFDRALLDAPCSSIGAIRRNPDVKYRHRKGDLKRFKEKQIRLLSLVSALVKAGGILVYSVCSTEPEEGEEVVAEFLKDFPDFYIIETAVPFLGRFMDGGFFRTSPPRDNMDGFFGVRLCRRASKE